MVVIIVLASLWYRAHRHAHSQGASKAGERGPSEIYIKPELESMQIRPKRTEWPVMELESTQRGLNPAELPASLRFCSGE